MSMAAGWNSPGSLCRGRFQIVKEQFPSSATMSTWYRRRGEGGEGKEQLPLYPIVRMKQASRIAVRYFFIRKVKAENDLRSFGCRESRRWPFADHRSPFSLRDSQDSSTYCGETTTSNAEPLILRSSSCSEEIRGSGATEIAQSMPLSATNMPYFFRPLRIAWTSGEKPEMSKSCFSRIRSPI